MLICNVEFLDQGDSRQESNGNGDFQKPRCIAGIKNSRELALKKGLGLFDKTKKTFKSVDFLLI